MNYTKFMEALKGKQKKLDKNHNGKLDAQDFKILRKEENELDEALDPSEIAGNPRMYSADSAKKAYYHKNASAADKESLAKHLDRHHGNKEWRKPVKEELDESEYLQKTLDAYNKGKPAHAHAKIDTRTSAERKAETEKKLAGKAKPIASPAPKSKPVTTDDIHKQIAKSYANHRPGQYVGDSYELNGEVMNEDSLDEKLKPSMGAGEYIKDFQKSDAPQFAGKSKEKRRVMGIAAYLNAKRKMKEEVELDESYAKVETKKYSWGTMKTAHHGSSFSVPMHPENHKAIHALKNDQEHKFKDETGRHWTAKRQGDDVHLHSANDGPKTKIKHSDLAESHAPVAPTLDRKYIKGTPEHKAYKATKKPINGHPTNVKEEADLEEGVADAVKGVAKKAFKALTGGSDEDQLKALQKRAGAAVTGKKPVKEEADLEEGYIVKYHAADGEHKNSSKVFNDKNKAQAHADKGNSINKVGGKYTVHKIDSEGRPVKEAVSPITLKVNHALEAPHEEEWEDTGICPEHNEKDCHKCGKAGMKEHTGQKSYKEFMMMLEYESDKSGSYKHTGTYGSEYAKKEREKDEKGFDSENEPAKRGPKMGSKRGPKANLGSSKLHTK